MKFTNRLANLPQHVALVLLLVFLTTAMPAYGELTIVQDGKPRAAIRVQSDSEKPAKAAKELQHFIREMSGALLPILEEGQQADADLPITIHVGTTAAVGKMDLDIPAGFDPTPRPDSFEEEGYILKTVGNQIVIAGNNDGPYHGTLFATYDLLRMLGCRWYFPGPWGEIVPEKKTVTLPTLDITDRPDFAFRSVNLGGWLPSDKEEQATYTLWQTRVGMTANRKAFYPVAGDGFLAFLVSPHEYFEEHPEYFAMGKDGKRHRGRTVRHTMLCLSNEDVFDTAVKNIQRWKDGELENGYWEHGIGISPPDGTPYCYCEDCQAESQNFQYPRYVHRTTQSEEFFGFAARLANRFPDIFVSTMAYSLREIVPQGVEIPQNVSVTVAPISCDVLHPNTSNLWRRRDFVRNLKAWRAKTPHILIYDYNPGFLLGNWVPERDAANMAINARMYKEIGIKGLNREGRKAFMQTWISNYVMARMLWDVDTDLNDLKTDFYKTFFGPDAGPHVRAWWDACEQVLVESNMQAHEDWLINHIYTEEFARSLMKHVTAAQAAKTTEKQKQRVEAFALIADHLLAWGEATTAWKAMEYEKAADAFGRMLKRERELHEIYNFFHEYRNEKHARRAYFPGGKELKLRELAAKTNGEKGELVYALDLNAKFKRDHFNEGIVAGWDEPTANTDDWETRNTFYTWDQQEQPLTDAGHDYDGYGWYRFEFTVPEKYDGRPLHFYCGGVINEGWVWVNGEYVGHKGHKLWWGRPHEFEMDITNMVKPGQKNTLAIRVWNDAEVGGLYRRGFVYSPNETSENEASE